MVIAGVRSTQRSIGPRIASLAALLTAIVACSSVSSSTPRFDETTDASAAAPSGGERSVAAVDFIGTWDPATKRFSISPVASGGVDSTKVWTQPTAKLSLTTLGATYVDTSGHPAVNQGSAPLTPACSVGSSNAALCASVQVQNLTGGTIVGADVEVIGIDSPLDGGAGGWVVVSDDRAHVSAAEVSGGVLSASTTPASLGVWRDSNTLAANATDTLPTQWQFEYSGPLPAPALEFGLHAFVQVGASGDACTTNSDCQSGNCNCATPGNCAGNSGTCGVVCNATSCPVGCCNTSGQCVTGVSASACGSGGAACVSCNACCSATASGGTCGHNYKDQSSEPDRPPAPHEREVVPPAEPDICSPWFLSAGITFVNGEEAPTFPNSNYYFWEYCLTFLASTGTYVSPSSITWTTSSQTAQFKQSWTCTSGGKTDLYFPTNCTWASNILLMCY